MGGFYDSIHVRTESYHLIKDILTELAKSKGHKFYLAPVINGWISLFPNNYGQESLACEISKQIDADILQTMVYDDDIFSYLYYRGGKLIDEYNSCPDYFGEKVSAKEKKRLKGKPEVFIELVRSEDKVKKLRKLLKTKPVFNKIKFTKEAKQQIKKMEDEIKASSKAIKDMINDQGSVLKFLENNPELFKDEMDSLVKEAAAQGLKSTEELQKYLLEDEKAQQINMKIVEAYIKSRMTSKEFDLFRPDSDKWNKTFADIDKQISGQMVIDDKENIKSPEGLFASETMLEFAEVFGISNVVTSYEYLKSGETDGIKEWEKFVEIA